MNDQVLSAPFIYSSTSQFITIVIFYIKHVLVWSLMVRPLQILALGSSAQWVKHLTRFLVRTCTCVDVLTCWLILDASRSELHAPTHGSPRHASSSYDGRAPWYVYVVEEHFLLPSIHVNFCGTCLKIIVIKTWKWEL